MARVGSGVAEVVVQDAQTLSIHLRVPAKAPDATAKPDGDAPLDVVTAWAGDGRIFRSKPWELALVTEARGDQVHMRHYAGEIPSAYDRGGELLLIAPIVWVDGAREAFDITITVPPKEEVDAQAHGEEALSAEIEPNLAAPNATKSTTAVSAVDEETPRND